MNSLKRVHSYPPLINSLSACSWILDITPPLINQKRTLCTASPISTLGPLRRYLFIPHISTVPKFLSPALCPSSNHFVIFHASCACPLPRLFLIPSIAPSSFCLEITRIKASVDSQTSEPLSTKTKRTPPFPSYVWINSVVRFHQNQYRLCICYRLHTPHGLDVL